MKRSEGKLNLLIGTALLSPALRLIPGSAAALGGTSAWLGPLAALPLALLYAALLQRLRRTLRPGECFPELILRTLSRRFGRALLLLFAGWLLLYTGFLLRAGADRLQITAYPRSGPGFFVLSMGLLLLTAALGPFRSLTRMARVVGPALFLVLLLMLGKAAKSVDCSELLPLGGEELLCSAFPALDLLAFGLAARFFFSPGRTGKGEAFLPCVGRLGLFSLLLCALGAAIQGRFGAALSARLSAPFFALVRNLVFFRSLERMEALVVGLWILPDFLLGGLCLQGAQRCLRLALGQRPEEGESRLDFSGGRLLIWLCGVVSIALGLLLGRDPASLQHWSRTIIPLLSLFYSFLLLPVTALLCGRKRMS